MATQGRIRQSLYEVLGVEPDASEDEIRAAYKSLARKYHPDLNQGNAQAEMMFKAGATFVVVMGVAHENTIHEAVRAAKKLGGYVMGDVMLDPGREALRIREAKNGAERTVILGPTATPHSVRGLRAARLRQGRRAQRRDESSAAAAS